MIEQFIEYMKNEGLAKNTYESYANDIKLFEKYYEDSYGENMNELIRADILMYINFLKNNNCTPATINRKLTAMKRYNEFLVSNHIQDKVVIRYKDYIKVQNIGISKTLPTMQEINRLKHFACKDVKQGKRDYCLIVLLIYGGFREDELVNIKISDVKLNERFITVIGKGNKFRQVLINNDMYDALSEYLEERESMNIKNLYLFIGQKNKGNLQPLNRNFCNRVLAKYKKLCKIENLHPHLLRAFFCSNALHNAGYTIEQVAAQAGHSSLDTTKKYLLTDKNDLLAKANNM